MTKLDHACLFSCVLSVFSAKYFEHHLHFTARRLLRLLLCSLGSDFVLYFEELESTRTCVDVDATKCQATREANFEHSGRAIRLPAWMFDTEVAVRPRLAVAALACCLKAKVEALKNLETVLCFSAKKHLCLKISHDKRR